MKISFPILICAILLSVLPSCKKNNETGGEEDGPKVINVSSITLDREEATIHLGSSLTLVATVRPENATDASVTWDSSNKSVATVEDGVVTPIKEGLTIITAKAGSRVTSCSVKVLAALVPLESVSLDKTELTIEVEQSASLVYTLNPTNADVESLEWKSSDPSIASVEDGVVTGLAVGKTDVTITVNGITASCEVKVKEKFIPAESVSLSEVIAALPIGGTLTLIATVLPENATDKSVTWTSSAPEIASVEEGVVTGHSKGSATITVRTVNGGHTAECRVTVDGKPLGGDTEGLEENEIPIED